MSPDKVLWVAYVEYEDGAVQRYVRTSRKEATRLLAELREEDVDYNMGKATYQVVKYERA